MFDRSDSERRNRADQQFSNRYQGGIMRAIKILSLALGILGCVFPISAFPGNSFAQVEAFKQAEVRKAGLARWVPGEIIVRFRPGVSEEIIQRINDSLGASTLSMSKRGEFRRLRIPGPRTVQQMVEVYSRNPNVEYAEPNFIASALMTPNDSYYSYQWNLDNLEHGGIHMESAWDVETGSSGVVVAVIDTGVAYEDYDIYQQAPDLANTSFVSGYDFVNRDSHPNDDEGHGTHVAGTVAQSTNNGSGVAGVAHNCSIMPIKVLDSSGSGTYADIADGIYFAADNGAAVINMSLGGTSSSITLENALAYAYTKGTTIVCSAGNEYTSGNPVIYPAAYDEYCIAVGATRYDETRSYYSSTGSYVDIAAPGGDLNVDQNGDGYVDGILQQTFGSNLNSFGYYFYQGTSMAAPHVSGVAALVIANGVNGPDQVREALEATAEDKGTAGWDEEFGWGLVRADAALSYSAEPVRDVAVSDISTDSWCFQGDTVSLVVSVSNQGNYDETFTVSLTDTTDTVEIGNQSLSLPAGGSADLTFSWDTSISSLGDHILTAEADIVSGETDTADNTMTATITVKNPVHDVAVTAVDSPLEVYLGDLATVIATVENQGTYGETTTVSLSDVTDGTLAGSQQISLNAGATSTVSFDWDTAGATAGDHLLEVTTSQVDGETDTADNSMTATTTIKDQSAGPVVFVADIVLELQQKGPNYEVQAKVAVVDENGGAVKDVVVDGDWELNGSYLSSATATTKGDGSARLSTGKLEAGSGDIFTLTITGITRDGYTYDAANNLETSDSITVP